MPSLVVIGAQWGDEGKGKIVDFLTSSCDWVVRFQGGNNAGHTLVVNGVKTKLTLIPSGILRSEAKCLIGAGVVLNARVLLQEIQSLRANGVMVSPERLVLDREAHLILPYHVALDLAREEAKGKEKIGTTGRGIGPAYEDRAARRGVRLAELFYPDELRKKIESNLKDCNNYLKYVVGSSTQVGFDEVWSSVEEAARELKPYVQNGSLILNRALRLGKRVVFEGAQGTLLDQSFGTVPFVTSSHTIAGAATTGSGVGPGLIDYVVGVAKAYSTRVGSGPFPTELDDQIGEGLRQRGAEFGTVTGRPRRCGWLDGVALRRAYRLSNFNSIILTKLDVLSGIEKLKICTAYRLDGAKLEDLPALVSELERVEPEYIEVDGWQEDISGVREISKLPGNARKYIDKICEVVGCPVNIVSVGAERDSTLLYGKDAVLSGFLGK